MQKGRAIRLGLHITARVEGWGGRGIERAVLGREEENAKMLGLHRLYAISCSRPWSPPPRTYPTRTRRKEEEEDEEEDEEGWGVSKTLTTRSWYCIPGTASVCKRRYDDKEDEAKGGIVIERRVRKALLLGVDELGGGRRREEVG